MIIGKELKIIFKDDKAYLSPDKPLNFAQLGLADYERTAKSSAFWNISVVSHFSSEKRIFVRINSCENGEASFGFEQDNISHILSTIETVSFKSIPTGGLLNTLKRSKSNLHLTKTMSKNSGLNEQEFAFETNFLPTNEYKPHSIATYIEQTKQDVKIIREHFSFPIKNLKFENGEVSFQKKFKIYSKPLTLNIKNENLCEEFDAVKNYFSNILRTKKIIVSVNIEIIDSEINFIDISSKEIEAIHESTIKEVRVEILRTSLKKRSLHDEKVPLTKEEYLKENTDITNTSIFYKNDNEFFEDLLKISNSKHYQHLRFLSSKHAHELISLRFINKPFSFLFLLIGNDGHYVIWETLNTEEATYVWRIPTQSLEMWIKKIDEVIKGIGIHGKYEYVRNKDNDFIRILHQYNEKDGFMKWKLEIESFVK